MSKCEINKFYLVFVYKTLIAFQFLMNEQIKNLKGIRATVATATSPAAYQYLATKYSVS